MKHIWKLFLVLVLIFSAGTRIHAEDDGQDTSGDKKEYEYKVTFKGGKYSSKDQFDEFTVKYGTRLDAADLNAYADEAASTDSRYRFSGWHISGIEGKIGSIVINEDTVLVATYALPGVDVEYTIQYVDENGKQLKKDETFHGTAGDDMVLAYLYIEGYRPQAYSLSRTLTADGPNVFKFTYSEVKPGEEVVEVEEGTTTTRRNTRRNNNSGNGQKAENAGSKKSGSSNKTGSAENKEEDAENTSDETGQSAEEPEKDESEETSAPAGNESAEEAGTASSEEPSAPAEVEEVKDDTSAPKGKSSDTSFLKNPWTFFGLLGGGAVAAGGLGWYLLGKKKNEEA